MSEKSEATETNCAAPTGSPMRKYQATVACVGLAKRRYVDAKARLLATQGAAFRDHREDCGISLREVARRAELSAPFVSDVELGRRMASERLALIYDGLANRLFVDSHENSKP